MTHKRMPSLDSWNPLGWPLTSGPKAWSAEQGWALATVKPLTRPLQAAPTSLPSPFRFYWQITLLCPQITSNLLLGPVQQNKQMKLAPHVSSKMLKTVDCHLHAVTWFLPLLPPFVVHWNSLLLWFTTFCFLLDFKLISLLEYSNYCRQAS